MTPQEVLNEQKINEDKERERGEKNIFENNG